MPTIENRTYAVAAAVVVLVLIAAGLFWARANRAPASDIPAKTATTTSATTTASAIIDERQATVAAAAGESVSADTQSAGPTVRASFALTRDSWVAVQDGKGGVLGASRFAAGTTSGIIELLRPTVPGETYTVVIYADNGNRVFDLYTDELIEGIAASFKVQ